VRIPISNDVVAHDGFWAEEAIDLFLEGGELFPIGDGVAIDGEFCGDGFGGAAGDEEAGGLALAGL